MNCRQVPSMRVCSWLCIWALFAGCTQDRAAAPSLAQHKGVHLGTVVAMHRESREQSLVIVRVEPGVQVGDRLVVWSQRGPAAELRVDARRDDLAQCSVLRWYPGGSMHLEDTAHRP